MHVAVGALLRGLAGAAAPAALGRARPASAGGAAPPPMEAAAALLGPPQGKFVPPCRMLTPAPAPQAPAPDA